VASAGYSPSVEPGAQELNEAMSLLIGGAPLDETSLRKLWRKVLDVTAVSSGQSALAQALALSFTGEVIFLSKLDRDKMMASAKTHPVIAIALQQAFLEAWTQAREQLLYRKMRVSLFNQRKEKFFQPWVSGLIDLEEPSLHPSWLREVSQKGLLKDEEIQMRFPKFVLSLMNQQERIAQRVTQDETTENVLSAAFANADILWKLSQIHIPTLEKWAEKHQNDPN
jgi:hypothetical protein